MEDTDSLPSEIITLQYGDPKGEFVEKNLHTVATVLVDEKFKADRQVAVDYVHKNKVKILDLVVENGITDSNEANNSHIALAIFSEYLKIVNDKNERRNILRSLREHVQTIEERIVSNSLSLAHSFAVIAHHYNQDFDTEEQQHFSFQRIQEYLTNQDASNLSRRVFFESYQESNILGARSIVMDSLSKYIDDSPERRNIVDSWLETDTPMGRIVFSEWDKSLLVMGEIDSKTENGTKRLNEIFGITHFARYEVDMLVEQLKDWDEGDSDSKSGVVISSHGDWNYNLRGDALRKLYCEAKKMGFKTRFVEASNITEFINKQRKLVGRFGKFHFRVINAHGEPSGIDLGRGRVTTDDMKEIRKMQEETDVRGMRTLFFSCSTGGDHGIAEAWAGKDYKVIAPDRDTGVESLKIHLRPGRLPGFVVKYRMAETVRFPQ